MTEWLAITLALLITVTILFIRPISTLITIQPFLTVFVYTGQLCIFGLAMWTFHVYPCGTAQDLITSP